MQVILDDIAHLGTPPDLYENAEQYHADIQRLGALVAEFGGDFLGVDDYARLICHVDGGAESILAYTTGRPNFCWDMAPNSPFYAVECFIDDVSDAAAAIESGSPTEDDDSEDEEADDDEAEHTRASMLRTAALRPAPWPSRTCPTTSSLTTATPPRSTTARGSAFCASMTG
jgi:hypothetical protein